MNNSIEQIMDVINDKVGDYISDGMYQDLKSDITFALAEKDKEIERRVQEINACYGFQKKQAAEIQALRDMCDKLAGTLNYFVKGMPVDFTESYGVRVEAREALSAYAAMKSGQPEYKEEGNVTVN